MIMKTIERWAGPALILGLSLLGSPSSHAFCNPEARSDRAAIPHARDGKTTPQCRYAPCGETRLPNPVYHGYRYYNAGTGRWLSRDPILEDGGPNLYCFNGNAPQSAFDVLGWCTSCGGASALGPGGNPTEPPPARPPTAQDECKGSLDFKVSEPQAKGSANEIRELCRGHPLSAACSWADGKELSYPSECKPCGCKWKVILKVTTTCNIVYADPNKVKVSYPVGLPAVITHEKCHCDDWKAALQGIITVYDEMESSSKEQCEVNRANVERVFRSNLARAIWGSVHHKPGKYDPERECYARGGLLE